MDEAKLISRQIAETKVEISVCTRLKDKGIAMRLGKPVGDLLAAYELKLVDLENQLQALAKKPAAKPATSNRLPTAGAAPVKPGVAKPVVAAAKPVVAATAVKPVVAKPAAPVAAKAVAAKSAALEPKAAPRKAPAAPAKRR